MILSRNLRLAALVLCLAVIFPFMTPCSHTENVVTAIAAQIDPENPRNISCYARILGYNKAGNTLTVELLIPEVFHRGEIRSLEPGDILYTNGAEIIVQTIEVNDEYGYVLINEGEYQYAPGSVTLHEDPYGNYSPEKYGHKTYITLAVLECPVRETLLFLDYISADTYDSTDLPSVSSAAEFINAVENNEPGLDIDNISVVFDNNGDLAVIQRFFVSWQ